MNRFYVYEHWRPDRNECFYVGKGCGSRANSMAQRNAHHINIQDALMRMGMCVEVRLIASGLQEVDAFVLERERIAFWRNDGADLANRSAGGEGSSGCRPSPEAIAKTAAAHRGMKRSAETRAKISAKAKARILRPEAVEIMAMANRGKKRPPFSEEHKAKIGAASRGRKMSSGTRAKLLAANTGRSFQHTEEARAKISAARKGKGAPSISDEHKAKISAANKGKTFSAEHRERLSAAAKARWAKSAT